MSKYDPEDPSYESVFGQEVPVAEDVENEIYPQEQAAEEVASSPAVTEHNPTKPNKPIAKSDKEGLRTPPSTVLQDALKGRDINDILPQLSDEEKNLLAVRFNLATGARLVSQRQAADQLGMDRSLFREKEAELMDQISYLADKDLPGYESSNS